MGNDPAVNNFEVLRAAIERLYATFAIYPLQAKIEGCPCCVFPKDQERIRIRPLQELTGDDLLYYSGKAMTTWGNVEDFKHFLPRLLELLAFEDYGYMPGILIGKLAFAHWRNWPEVEQAAVEAYFIAIWQVLLQIYPYSPATTGFHNFVSVDDFFRDIGQIFDDLSPLLSLWRLEHSLASLRHLAQFTMTILSDIVQDRRTGYWKRITPWLFDPKTLHTLEEASYTYIDEPFADELAEAFDALSVMLPRGH